MLLAVFLMVCLDVVVKILLKNYPVLQITFLRGSISLFIIGAAGYLANGKSGFKTHYWRWHILRTTLMTISTKSPDGCKIRRIPMKPTATADHRHFPTTSPKKGPDNAVMIIGEIKTMTIQFTNGMRLKATKNVIEDMVIKTVLRICHFQYWVLKLSFPLTRYPAPPIIKREIPPRRKVTCITW
jgi:hypothetical protein